MPVVGAGEHDLVAVALAVTGRPCPPSWEYFTALFTRLRDQLAAAPRGRRGPPALPSYARPQLHVGAARPAAPRPRRPRRARRRGRPAPAPAGCRGCRSGSAAAGRGPARSRRELLRVSARSEGVGRGGEVGQLLEHLHVPGDDAERVLELVGTVAISWRRYSSSRCSSSMSCCSRSWDRVLSSARPRSWPTPSAAWLSLSVQRSRASRTTTSMPMASWPAPTGTSSSSLRRLLAEVAVRSLAVVAVELVVAPHVVAARDDHGARLPGPAGGRLDGGAQLGRQRAAPSGRPVRRSGSSYSCTADRPARGTRPPAAALTTSSSSRPTRARSDAARTTVAGGLVEASLAGELLAVDGRQRGLEQQLEAVGASPQPSGGGRSPVQRLVEVEQGAGPAGAVGEVRHQHVQGPPALGVARLGEGRARSRSRGWRPGARGPCPPRPEEDELRRTGALAQDPPCTWPARSCRPWRRAPRVRPP